MNSRFCLSFFVSCGATLNSPTTGGSPPQPAGQPLFRQSPSTCTRSQPNKQKQKTFEAKCFDETIKNYEELWRIVKNYEELWRIVKNCEELWRIMDHLPTFPPIYPLFIPQSCGKSHSFGASTRPTGTLEVGCQASAVHGRPWRSWL